MAKNVNAQTKVSKPPRMRMDSLFSVILRSSDQFHTKQPAYQTRDRFPLMYAMSKQFIFRVSAAVAGDNGRYGQWR
jgi:hypothetical protein